MHIRWIRIVLSSIAVEILTILVLVVIVAVTGPDDPDEIEAYAQRLGYFVGPIGGFVFCVGGGWFVACGLSNRHLFHGLLLGASVALIDVAILLAAAPGFDVIFVISNIGRIVAGTIGGCLASLSGNATIEDRHS